ncbi:MAG: guanylate kinase [Calditrichae bacterium]|nr:guanylate kinase [Calditrichota bacterium]MCB9057252.1 guanylate kinase [Calditrichia bacterium]
MHTFKSDYIVFSAPSGAGKTTIVKELLSKYPDELALSISATTRPMRSFEEDGKDYFFLTNDEFTKAIQEQKFLEFEEVHGNYYGTLIDKVDFQVKIGKVVLFDIDVKGAESIKQKYPDAILIFIKPPDKETLRDRLVKRKSETEETISLRLKRLDFEYEQARFFDYTIINNSLEKAVQDVEEVIIVK